MENVKLEKSYLSLVAIGLWSWILLFIPLLIRFLKIYTRKYEYDDKNIYIREGVLTKESISIPLVKIETVRGSSNLFGNGTLTLGSGARGASTAGMQNLEYIKDVDKQRLALSNKIEELRKKHGIKLVDTF